MVIMAVDPDREDLKKLVRFLRMVYPGCHVVMFTDAEAAAVYVRDNPIDVMFTEVVLTGMTGFGLKEKAEAVQPALLTVLVTGSDAYANQAIRTRASGYILKPVTRKAIWESLCDTKFNIARQA